jgi:hypothetical protein
MIAPFQCFVCEISYVLCFSNGWLVGFVVELFMMFGKDGYQFTTRLSPFFVIYEGDALGDVLKINGNRELAENNKKN